MQSAVAIGKVPVTKALFKYASAPREAQKAVEALSPFMVERMQTFQRDMALISGALDEDPTFSKWGKFQQSVVFAGFLAIQKSQYHLVDLPTWMAAFDQEIAGGASTEDAVVVADTMVARAQGSGLLSDRTGFERGDLSDDQRNVELARVFTVFGSYMISGKFNVMMQRLRGTNWKSPADMLNTMVDMMMLFALEGLLAAWVTGRGYDEDEDEKGFMWWWFTETAQTAAATMPFIRDTVSILQGFDAGGAVGGLEKMLVTAPVNATNLLIGDDDARMRNLKQVINAGGVLTKMPATQVNRILTAILDDDLSVRDDINPLDTFFGRRDK